MPFVHVVNINIQTQLVDQHRPADAEDDGLRNPGGFG